MTAFSLLSLAFLPILAKAAPLFASLGTPAARVLPSSVSLLFNNNLNYTQDAHHSSFLLLHSPQTNISEGQAACSWFSESLLTAEQARGNASDLTDLLRYHSYRGDVGVGQHIMLADATVAFHAETDKLVFLGLSEENQVLAPCLCTQSDRQTLASQSNATAENTVSVINPETNNAYNGYRNLKSFRFLGIPYSNGPARWEYAQVESSRGEVFEATSFASPCTQTAVNRSSEDCLYLNIWTPFLPAPEAEAEKHVSKKPLRPVFFYLHGGAFVSGEGSDPMGEGANVVSRGDVVMVFPNYRLSNLGFLNIPGTNITGNYGIADQMTALEWVRQNIAYFGGDPNHIVIHGDSAGAASVQAMLHSPVARGKFAGAIISSNPGGHYGSEYSRYLTPEAAFDKVGKVNIALAGCVKDDLDQTVACLKALPAKDLVAKKFATLSNDSQAHYIIQDGHYITSEHLEVTNPTQVAQVPVMIGTTAEDGAPFLNFADSGTTRQQAIDAVMANKTNPSAAFEAAVSADEALFPFPTTTNNASLNAFNLTASIFTDLTFRCVGQATAYSAAKHKTFPRVYSYQFQRTYQQYFRLPHEVCDSRLGSFRCHGGDLLYYFGTLDQFGSPYRDAKDLLFGRLVMDHWTSFVRHLDPNPSKRYLAARGKAYKSTADALAKSGRWEPVDVAGKSSLRLLDWPSKQSDFDRVKQCEVEGLPISTYWETAA